MLPFLPLFFLDKLWEWVWAVAAAWFVVWNLFVGWRYARYLKEISIENDRQYDRVGKYGLPPEYPDSESATRARQRRKS